MRFERTIKLRADPLAVWNALTDPALTKLYLFECEAISDWNVGSPLEFKTGAGTDERVHVKGVIEAIDPPNLLQHTCYAVEFENTPEQHTVVVYRLKQTDEFTELSVTQGEFSDEEPLSQHESSWDYVLTGLKSLLESP